MQEKLVNYCNLSIYSDPVIKFNFKNNDIIGFSTQSGKEIKASKIILTSGTFFKWSDTYWGGKNPSWKIQ